MRAVGDVLLDLQRMRGVEFSIDEAVKHQLHLGALRWGGGIHFFSPQSSAS
jgi:hypothetical protein